MVAEARRAYPELRCEVGRCWTWTFPTPASAGYSIIHIPWELRPRLFAEFHRVLAPGGQLMLGFQVGDERHHRDEAWGVPIRLDWYRQRPDEVAELLREAGFEIVATVVRQPELTEKTPHGYVLARRPAP